VEAQIATGEIARLEALLGADPGSAAFPALAEANRRAGRLEEAERVAREGLRRRPELFAGRVALALALLDLGRVEDARAELERVLEDVPDHPLALDVLARSGAAAAPDSLAALADDEIDGAFDDAETSLAELVDANEVAARAVRAADLDEPEGVIHAIPDSPFATRTVAELLDRQGHGDEAAAIRRELTYRAERTDAPVASDSRREQLIATLERWLENLRSDKQ
jgi:tetratricopeptide (TPR) repeat protein